jgi:hypothetical protein
MVSIFIIKKTVVLCQDYQVITHIVHKQTLKLR